MCPLRVFLVMFSLIVALITVVLGFSFSSPDSADDDDDNQSVLAQNKAKRNEKNGFRIIDLLTGRYLYNKYCEYMSSSTSPSCPVWFDGQMPSPPITSIPEAEPAANFLNRMCSQ